MKKRSSLQFILTRNYILLAVLPVLIFGAVTLLLFSKNLTREISDKNQSLAISVAGEVQTFLKEPLSLLLQVREILSSPDILADDGLAGYMDSVVETYPFFEMIQLLDQRGVVTHVSPFEEEYLGLDMSRQSFYSTTLEASEPTWSPTFISMRSGSPTISVSVSTQHGMIVGYLNLAALSSIVKKVSDENKYVVITDQEGTIIADYAPLRVKHRENLSSFHQLRILKEDEQDAYIVTVRKEKVIASVADVPLTGWVVIFLQHYKDAFAPLRDSRFILIVTICITLIAATLAAVAGARATSKPFVRLLNNVKRVAAGDYSLSKEPGGFHEIRELDASFRLMADAISQRESSILESEQIHRELIEALPHGLQENDLNGVITFTNDAYNKIFECLPGEAIGKTIWETEINRERREKLKDYFFYIINEQPPPESYLGRSRTFAGNIIEIQVDWQYKRDPKGELLGLISVITDITEKKHLESNLRQAQKMEAIGTLAGGIAHDFNNILSAILGYSQMIFETLPEGSQNRKFQEQVIKASRRARDLVNHLLIFSRKQDHKKGAVEIHKIVKEATTFLRATLPTTIRIELEISDKTGTIEADATQIHQIVLNLCTNAAHAMENSGGVLTVRLDKVKIEESDALRLPELQPGEYALLSVRDTGEGIAPEDVDKIFDPFYTTKEIGKGTGMGLAVVHGIVSSHSGAVTVKSVPGKWTRFDVYFPLSRDEIAVVESGKDVPAGKGERILVVDDEKDIIRVNSFMLEDAGYQITSSTDSQKALELFLKNPHEFDLLITDQTMPGLTGVELARRIKEVRPDLPILLCTGYSATLTPEQIAGAGVNRSLMKPVERDQLLQTVASLLA